MRIVVLAKRHYTNRDALQERFGRIYQLPLHWHRRGCTVSLELLDYRSGTEEVNGRDGFEAHASPVRRLASLRSVQHRFANFHADVIVASGDCFAGLIGYRLAKRSGARFIFDVYDDYRTFGAYRLFLGWDAFGFLRSRADSAQRASERISTPWGSL